MSQKVIEVAVHAPHEKVEEIEAFFHEDSRVVEARKAEGEIIEVSRRGSDETNVMRYQVFVSGGEATARAFASDLFERNLLPPGRKWMVFFTGEDIDID